MTRTTLSDLIGGFLAVIGIPYLMLTVRWWLPVLLRYAGAQL